MTTSRQTKDDWRLVSLAFIALAAIVLWPAFKAVVLFLRDMPWPEQIYLESYMHQGMTASFPLLTAIRLLNYIVPADWLQKLLLLSVLTLCGVGMYYLQKRLNKLRTPFTLFAAVVYMINPYVLDRLLAGHWLVLAGYAFLPFFLRFAYEAHATPNRRSITVAVGAWAVYPLISIHWWYITTLFLLPAALHKLYIHRGRVLRRDKADRPHYPFFTLRASLRKQDSSPHWLYAVSSLLGVWLIFLIFRYSNLTQTIDTTDFVAFATQPIHFLGAWGSVLTLRGFWQHAASVIPTKFEILWILTCIGLLAFAYYAQILLRKRHPLRAKYAFWVFVFAVILAVGYSSKLGHWFTDALRIIMPGYNGLREPQKLTGLVTFIYALMAPYAMQHIWSNRKNYDVAKYLVPAVMGGYALCMIGALHTAHATFIPHTYPADWRSTNTMFYYVQPKRVLVLPWERYIHLPFAGNTVTANPALTYFAASADTQDNSGIQTLDTLRSLSSFDRQVLSLRSSPSALSEIRAAGYDYILLLRTEDYTRYKQQLDAAGLELVESGPSLYVYRTKQQLLDQTF